MTRLSRFDYDVLTQAHVEGYVPVSWCDKPGQLDRLLASRTLIEQHGSLVLTAHGRNELHRVRGLGESTVVPEGFFLAPRRPTDAFLKRFGFERHAYRAFVKALTR